MAKIEIMMLLDFSVGSTIEHKPCAELLFVLGGKIGFFWMEFQSAQYKQ